LRKKAHKLPYLPTTADATLKPLFVQFANAAITALLASWGDSDSRLTVFGTSIAINKPALLHSIVNTKNFNKFHKFYLVILMVKITRASY
jgi:hypothetical protein